MNYEVRNKKKTKSKVTTINTLLSIMILFFVGCLTQPVFADDEEWPKEYQMPEAKIVVYQPQLESFNENKLTARSAVSISKKGAEPVFGTMWFAAGVMTDRAERIVTLIDIDITNVKFPTTPDPAKVAEFSKLINLEIARAEITISLDRLLTMMELVEAKKKGIKNLKTEPPRIIVVNHPAVLVSIDGDPELRRIEGSSLMRVINTPFFVVFDTTSKKYYLKGGESWFSSTDVKGKWENTLNLPASVLEISKKEFAGLEESAVEEKADANRLPEIIVSTIPTELIITEGKPSYKNISNTNLLYVNNTESDLFMEIDNQKYFVLISGRWYSSKSLNGPWSFVQANKLPADFAKIPESSDKAGVLANVGGTTQAKEAILDTYIPQTSAVDRNQKVAVEVVYDGSPKFEKIEKTSLQYAVNTPETVIRVGGYYYLCQDAVWYISDQPTGPWVIAVNIPEEIYTIPPSSPVYNVTYVYVYDHTPKVVYAGHYPGYYGSYVFRGTVVYGTGYIYPAWYGSVYYARPVTWGFSVHYSCYTGSWGVRVGYGAPLAWWGRTARHAYWRDKRHDAYKDRRDFRRDRHDDRRDHREDRYSDRREGMKERKERRRDAHGDRRDTRVKDKTAGQRPGRNNVYSDRQGNVYRQTDKGWQQRGVGGWSRPESKPRSSYSRSGNGSSNLNRDSQARSRGSSRSSNYQQHKTSIRSSFSGSRGGSRIRSGGGRGRR